MSFIWAELETDSGYIEVIIEFKIDSIKEIKSAQFENVSCENKYVVFAPEHINYINKLAKEWVSDKNIILCEEPALDPPDDG